MTNNPMDPLIGQSLGKYKIEQLLGEGGMGAVYKARDVTLGRFVAIKVMHPQYARQTEFRQRLLQEAQTAARLDHPGIVKVHDFAETNGFLYIVMEYIQGDNLQQMLQKLQNQRQWVPLADAVQMIREIGQALAYAHRQQVLHRDIKPANIMLKINRERPGHFQPIVTDLGLAKWRDGGLTTQANSTMGTPAYMSPEQAMGEETDARSDVYSLGVLLYELAVGRRPFPITSVTEAIRYHTRIPPPAPREIRPDLPVSIARVILYALQKDPVKRFQTAGALVQALDTVQLSDLPITVPPGVPAGPMSVVTMVQASIAGQSAPALQGEFPAQPPLSAGGGDQFQVLQPDNQTRLWPIRAKTLTIGRGRESDLVIDDSKASRQHVRIEFDGRTYTVTDLDSTNGTRLGNTKLNPGAAVRWNPEQELHIGNHRLRLIQPSVNNKGPAATEIYIDNSQAGGARATEIFSSAPSVPARSRRRLSLWMAALLVGIFTALSGGFWYLFGFGGQLPIADQTATVVVLSATATTPPATATPAPPTNTLAPLTNTPEPLTSTPIPPTATTTVVPSPSTDTPVPPTATPLPTSTLFLTPTPLPTSTPLPPTDTPTPKPPTLTPIPTDTPTPKPPTPTPIPTHEPPPTDTPTGVVHAGGNSGTGNSATFVASVTVVCNDARREVWFEGTVTVDGLPRNDLRVAFKSTKVPGDAPATVPAITGANGYYSHIVDGNQAEAKDKSLEVWVIDNAGNRISDYGFWHTDGAGGNCNKAVINFSK